MKKKYEIFYVNAFSEKPFKGNPAAVCFLEEEISDHILQNIATEINFAETAFVKKLETEIYNIRWFSIKQEVSICGHATLAAAKVIFSKINSKQIIFKSSFGDILASKEKDLIVLNFLKDVVEIPKIENIDKLKDALGIKNYKNLFIGKYTKKLIFHLENEKDVLKLNPNFKKMLDYSSDKINGVAITAQSKNNEYDFITRCFNPWIGIEEDYVTGSVHTLLGEYYSKLLNKNNLIAIQKSKREGILYIGIKGKERIYIKGKAFIFLNGFINI